MDDDLVAGLPARDAGADLPDDAGGVGAADVVAVLGVVAVAHDRHGLAERRPDVVVVHARGHHPDDHLEGGGLGDLDLLELEGVLRLALALLADDPRGHRRRQLAGLGRDLGDLTEIDCHALLDPLSSLAGMRRASNPTRPMPRRREAALRRRPRSGSRLAGARLARGERLRDATGAAAGCGRSRDQRPGDDRARPAPPRRRCAARVQRGHEGLAARVDHRAVAGGRAAGRRATRPGGRAWRPGRCGSSSSSFERPTAVDQRAEHRDPERAADHPAHRQDARGDAGLGLLDGVHRRRAHRRHHEAHPDAHQHERADSSWP